MVSCIYDGMLFERSENNIWICKVYAMKGPRGYMYGKEVPKKYAAPIEKAYQHALKNPQERFPELEIIGRIKPEPLPRKRKVSSDVASNTADILENEVIARILAT